MTTQNLILVDSNIFVYSLSVKSEKKDTARKFLKDYQYSLVTAHQNILEATRILSHPKTPDRISVKQAYERISKIVQGLVLVSPNIKSKQILDYLIGNHRVSPNKVFDAYLVSTALSNGINTIATDNEKDFKIYKQIKILNPFK